MSIFTVDEAVWTGKIMCFSLQLWIKKRQMKFLT